MYLGDLSAFKSEISEATDYFIEAQDYILYIEDPIIVASLCTELSEKFYNIGDYNRAFPLINISTQFDASKANRIYCDMLYSRYCIELKMYDQLEYVETLLTKIQSYYADTFGELCFEMAEIYLCFGDLYYITKNYTKAKENYDKVLEIYEIDEYFRLVETDELVYLYYSYGELYAKMELYELAIMYFEKVRKMLILPTITAYCTINIEHIDKRITEIKTKFTTTSRE